MQPIEFQTETVNVFETETATETASPTPPVTSPVTPTPPGGPGTPGTPGLPPLDFPQGGREDGPGRGGGLLFDNEFANPVAAPDEWDDVADDVLGRNEEDRRDPMDFLDDLPGAPDNDDNKDGFDPLGGFF